MSKNGLYSQGYCTVDTFTLMAAPKKKTSKSKRNSRRATWNRKAAIQAQRALSLGKSVLTNQSNSFEYPSDDDEDDDE